ncbi:hypothetical protein [Pseudomonas sp. B21-031]|uniref:hypothetical protein n=1 Tax=Pseudomonas sp. B21-031 TaxID=2895482 RepID=UPI002160ECE9|nr:hypothetical protein [Pseudomonas sp. B21-031]UVL68270.1 hypothetical protein LOY53_07220 [Pseudomonas sp. B21-031]
MGISTKVWFAALRGWLKIVFGFSGGRGVRLVDKTPRVPQMLGNVPGGQVNLLPVSALTQPLRVDVPMWPSSNPSVQYPESLTLFWNGDIVTKRTWVAPIPEADLTFYVSIDRLGEGNPVLTYRVVMFTGEPGDSDPLMLTIDRQAPLLPTENMLLLPPEVIAGGVTVEYLEQNGDELWATLPAYDAPQVGDCISYYWDREQGRHELVDRRVLTQADLEERELKLKYSGEMIRDRGDGPRYLHYVIEDRAGNQGAAASSRRLEVAATIPPRVLSWPELPKALGEGQNIVLETGSVREELVALIPDEAGVGSQEPVQMQWGEPGKLGAVTISDVPGTRRFLVPLEHLAAHSGKTIPLYYVASGDESTRREVRLTAFRPDAPPPQIKEAQVDTLSLRAVTTVAHVTQEAWSLISTDQRVSIKVVGRNSSGQSQQYVVVAQHTVTVEEMLAGLGGGGGHTIPKTFLLTLALNSRLTVEVTVSLDGGETWPDSASFVLQLTLVA